MTERALNRAFLPVASEDLSVFYLLHFSSLTVLLAAFFYPLASCLLLRWARDAYRRVCTRASILLMKFANENDFLSTNVLAKYFQRRFISFCSKTYVLLILEVCPNFFEYSL